MSTVRMQVINPAELGGREALEAATVPAISGSGRTDYCCGSCGSVLLKHMFYSQVRDLLVKCPRCASVNTIPRRQPMH